MDIIRISLLGICGVVLGFFLKGTRTEYVSFITMGIGIIILGLAVDKLDYLFRMIGKIQQSLSVDPEYFLTLIKMIGITCKCCQLKDTVEADSCSELNSESVQEDNSQKTILQLTSDKYDTLLLSVSGKPLIM